MRNLYAIRDRVANDLIGRAMYMLMVFRTNEEAARYFADAVNDTTSVLNKHPGDYELLHLGCIEDSGPIIPLSAPQSIITGDALIAVQQPALVKDA